MCIFLEKSFSYLDINHELDELLSVVLQTKIKKKKIELDERDNSIKFI